MSLYQAFPVLALGSYLKSISDQMYHNADKLYQQVDVPFQGRWFPVLLSLEHFGELSVSELAEKIGQTHSAVSQLSKILMKEGLITSRKDPNDERKRLLLLSEKGQEIVEKLQPLWKDISIHLSNQLSEKCPELLPALEALNGIANDQFCERVMQRQSARDTDNIVFCDYQTEYKQAFYDLNAQWLERFFEIEPYDHQFLANPEASVINKGGRIIFAIHQSKAIATCALYPEKPGIYELCKMAVHPDYQALGIGETMVKAAIKAFQELKGETLFLESSSKLPNALRLYEKMGFVLQAQRKPGSAYVRSDVYMIWGGEQK